MKIEQCLICKMVDGSYRVIGRKQFEYNKSDVTEIIDFEDNYEKAKKRVAKLNKKCIIKNLFSKNNVKTI